LLHHTVTHSHVVYELTYASLAVDTLYFFEFQVSHLKLSNFNDYGRFRLPIISFNLLISDRPDLKLSNFVLSYFRSPICI